MAGEHKCPLCPATFTRPQHVGRHLRAHTGDRPYECKECPLRFARSDLLSRHVNKAHRTPEPGEAKKEGKKGRRKSMPSSARKPSLVVDASAEVSGNGLGGEAMQAQTSATSSGSSQAQAQANASAEAKERARRASFDYPHPPQLQAQRMYPNHPLLAGTPSPLAWNTPVLNGLGRSPVNTFNNAMLSTSTNPAGFHPGLASPVRWPGPDTGDGSSTMMSRNESGYTSSSYNEFGVKKRACDQCNHSKVRCDFAHPCTRCSHRNVHCSYNKPPKSRTLPITPGLSYPMTAMPSGASLSQSLSPVSHFSSSPHMMESPVAQQMYQAQTQAHGQMLSSVSPIGSWPNGLTEQNGMSTHPMSQWVDLPGSTTGVPSSAMVNNGQALGMYMSSPHSQQPMLNPSSSVPISQQYIGQLPQPGSSTSPPQAMMATPSLTSHTTSPSSSDEPAERKSSLVGSMISLPLPPAAPVTGDTTIKGYTPPPTIEILPQASVVDPLSTAGSLYHWPTSAFTVDPRSQFRNPAMLAQSDDENDQNLHSSSASVFNDDEPIYDGRRRSSAGIWSAAFNSMSLQDGSHPNPNTVPDPYTAVQVAHATQPRPTFPMVTLNESAEPAKLPSMTDARDVWKLFMQDPQGLSGATPKQEKREYDTGMPMITPRPGMGRSLSKSNSMPDLKSPPLDNQSHLPNGTNDGLNQQEQQQQPQQHQQPQGGTGVGANHPNDDAHRQNWHNQIQQRQATFNIQPGGRFGRSGGFPANTGSEMLPPPFYGRPMASIIQHSGALQQTLAPERAPSYGLTPNAEKSNPTGSANITPPQTAGSGTWSRTPSKLAQRSSLTPALARPGNKRLPSQTLGADAKKRSASFSLWDEGDGDDGTLGDIEDGDNRSPYAFNPSTYVSHGGGTGHGYVHSRSASLGTNQGFDLSMFATTPGLPQMNNMGGYNVPMPMSQGGNWSSTT